MSSEDCYAPCLIANAQVHKKNHERNSVAEWLANGEEGGPNQDAMNDHNVPWLGVVPESYQSKALETGKRIKETEQVDPI